MTDTAISPLRQRMIEDMTIRQLGAKTQAGYIRSVKNFAAFLGHSPDRASIEDIRRYQLSLASSGLGVPSVNAAMTALRFFFKVTLRRGDVTEDIVFAREPRRLPVVLSPEEVARLLAAASGVKYKAALSIAYGTGLVPPRSSRSRSATSTAPDGHPRRPRQGSQGPLCDAVPAVARPVAAVVADCKAALLAVSGPGARGTAHHAAAQSRGPCGGTAGRDRQARGCSYLAPQLPRICSSRRPTSASFRYCSVTRSSTPRRSTPGSPSRRSARSPARSTCCSPR